jgi:hypothetical protein
MSKKPVSDTKYKGVSDSRKRPANRLDAVAEKAVSDTVTGVSRLWPEEIAMTKQREP